MEFFYHVASRFEYTLIHYFSSIC